MKRADFLPFVLLSFLLFAGFVRFLSPDVQAHVEKAVSVQPLVVKGRWQDHAYDLVYTVAFSSQQEPNGPLVIYRVSGTNQSTTVPIAVIVRSNAPVTPMLFPSSDGRYVALLKPLRNAFNGAALNVISTQSGAQSVILPSGVAVADQPVWSSDNQALYYHMGATRSILVSGIYGPRLKSSKSGIAGNNTSISNGYDEIHRIDLQRHDSVLLHLVAGENSLRMIGVDRAGALILTLARPGKPLALVRVPTNKQSTGNLDIITTL